MMPLQVVSKAIFSFSNVVTIGTGVGDSKMYSFNVLVSWAPVSVNFITQLARKALPSILGNQHPNIVRRSLKRQTIIYPFKVCQMAINIPINTQIYRDTPIWLSGSSM